jgi:hypothetical protein
MAGCKRTARDVHAQLTYKETAEFCGLLDVLGCLWMLFGRGQWCRGRNQNGTLNIDIKRIILHCGGAIPSKIPSKSNLNVVRCRFTPERAVTSMN